MMKQFDAKILEQVRVVDEHGEVDLEASCARIVSGVKRLSPIVTAPCGRKRWVMTCDPCQPARRSRRAFSLC